MTVIVMGTLRFGTGDIDRLLPEIEAMVTATRAEDGCDAYSYSRDLLDAHVMHVSERWRDDAALTAHFAAPHMKALNAAFATAKIEAMTVTAYTVAGERVLLSR